MQPDTNPQPTPTPPAPVAPMPQAPIPPAPTPPIDQTTPLLVPEAPIQPPASVQAPPAANSQSGMFAGRLNRAGFLLFFGNFAVILFIPVLINILFRGQVITNIIAIIFGLIAVVAYIPIGISVAIRRWHDLDQSGWLVLLGLIPFAGWLVLIAYLFLPGTKGPNRYGEPFTGPLSPLKVLLNQ